MLIIIKCKRQVCKQVNCSIDWLGFGTLMKVARLRAFNSCSHDYNPTVWPEGFESVQPVMDYKVAWK